MHRRDVAYIHTQMNEKKIAEKICRMTLTEFFSKQIAAFRVLCVKKTVTVSAQRYYTALTLATSRSMSIPLITAIKYEFIYSLAQ